MVALRVAARQLVIADFLNPAGYRSRSFSAVTWRFAARLAAPVLTAALLAVTHLPVSAEVMSIPGTFDVSPNGAATYSIPITVPPGTAGMVPKLSLEYGSDRGNGIVGLGWSLSGLPAITRCPRTLAHDGVHGGVNHDANDRFCVDGQRLVAISGTYGADGTEYRTEIERFTRIVSRGTAGTARVVRSPHQGRRDHAVRQYSRFALPLRRQDDGACLGDQQHCRQPR